MKRIIVRADDLGYSEGVNYGIAKTIRNGIVKSAGVMVNMAATVHGLDLIKGMDVCLGLHTNICVGEPVCQAEEIPSLVGADGTFHTSRAFRKADRDFIILEEVIREIEAQYSRFVELTGKKPDYFEGHAVKSENFFKGLEIVAKRHACNYLAFGNGAVRFKNSLLNVPSFVRRQGDTYQDLTQTFIDTLELYKDSDTIEMYVCHPGYLDQYLLEHSSLTERRVYETEMLCEESVKRWLKAHDTAVIKYSEVE